MYLLLMIKYGFFQLMKLYFFLDDHTRVILKEDKGEDYINASFISVSLTLGLQYKQTQVIKEKNISLYIVYECFHQQ